MSQLNCLGDIRDCKYENSPITEDFSVVDLRMFIVSADVDPEGNLEGNSEQFVLLPLLKLIICSQAKNDSKADVS